MNVYIAAVAAAAALAASGPAAAGEGIPSEVGFERAKVFMLKGDLAGAESELDAVLKADPSFAPAKYLTGQVLFMKKDYTRAAVMFDAYLKAEPSSTAAVRDLGVSLALSGKCSEALVFLGEALKDRPAGEAENYYTGLCLMRSGKYAEAIERLKAVEAAGGKAFALAARYNLAVAYARTGRRAEAVEAAAALSNERLPADAVEPVQRLRAAFAKGAEREVSPYWFSLAAGAQYDTNVVMLTEGTPQSVKNQVETAAFRFFVLGSGGWAPVQGETRSLALTLDGYRSFHTTGDAAQFNLTSLQPSLTYTERLGGDGADGRGARHTLSAGYEYQLNMFDGGDLNDVKEFGVFSQSHGLRLQWRGSLWTDTYLRGRYLFRYSDFANHDRTNFGHQAGFGAGTRFWHGRAGVLAEAALRFEDAANPFYDLLSPGLSVTVDLRPVPWFTLAGYAAAEREDHFRVDRTDWITSASISAVFRAWERHSFVLMFEWTNDASTDRNYTYSRDVVSLIYAVVF